MQISYLIERERSDSNFFQIYNFSNLTCFQNLVGRSVHILAGWNFQICNLNFTFLFLHNLPLAEQNLKIIQTLRTSKFEKKYYKWCYQYDHHHLLIKEASPRWPYLQPTQTSANIQTPGRRLNLISPLFFEFEI